MNADPNTYRISVKHVGENTRWHQAWTVSTLERIARHESGLAVRFDAAETPLEWRMTLAEELAPGYPLDLRGTPRLLYEALRIWQARAWNGRYLPACVITDGKHFDLPHVIVASRMPAGAMNETHLDALTRQWEKARGRAN